MDEQPTKKKKKILGMPIALVVIGLLVIGGATASLVSYLSNTTTETVTSSSPLTMYYDDGTNTMTASVFGGEDITYRVTTENKAKVDIQSYPITQVTAPVGETFSGAEFTKITLADPNYPAGIDVTSMMYYVKADGTLAPISTVGTENANTIKLFFDNNGDGISQKYNRPALSTEWNIVTITTNPALLGEYTIKSCQLYDITGTC